MNLNEEPAIIGMAYSLNLDVMEPVEAIRNYCREKVRGFLRRHSRIKNIEELQRLVCKRLNLAVQEIWTDDDINRLKREYASEEEIATAAAVATQLKPGTFGMLVQLSRAAKNGRPKYVAFIDCRGDKVARRVWTIWHEIAHCLTAQNQLSLPLRRTTVETAEKDPEEKLTDLIASDFAFYEPLFCPILESEFLEAGRLTFRVVERVRNRFNPEASFESTLNACAAKAPSPVILLEAGMTLKKSDQRLVSELKASISDFVPTLRVLKSIPNEVARNSMPFIPRQMRVPTHSLIARIHSSNTTTGSDMFARETLGAWTTSGGDRLRNVGVIIEARKFGERVVAIVTLEAA